MDCLSSWTNPWLRACSQRSVRCFPRSKRHASRVMKKCTSHWYCQPNEKRILLEIDTLNKKIWLYSPPKRMRSWHELIEPRIFVKRMFFLDPWQQKLQNTPKHTSNDVDKSPSLFTWVIWSPGTPKSTPLSHPADRRCPPMAPCLLRRPRERQTTRSAWLRERQWSTKDATLDTWQKRLSLALSIKYSIYMIM